MQLLIENAIKHNVVGGERKLVIRVSTDGENMIVSNNILPKLSAQTSLGVGHKYLKDEYLRHSTASLVFTRTDEPLARTKLTRMLVENFNDICVIGYAGSVKEAVDWLSFSGNRPK